MARASAQQSEAGLCGRDVPASLVTHHFSSTQHCHAYVLPVSVMTSVVASRQEPYDSSMAPRTCHVSVIATATHQLQMKVLA